MLYLNYHDFKELTALIGIDVKTILDETENVLGVLENLLPSEMPYNLSIYTPLHEKIKICGFDDEGAEERAYLVRIFYNVSFKSYEVYKFDFLVDVPILHEVCTN